MAATRLVGWLQTAREKSSTSATPAAATPDSHRGRAHGQDGKEAGRNRRREGDTWASNHGDGSVVNRLVEGILLSWLALEDLEHARSSEHQREHSHHEHKHLALERIVLGYGDDAQEADDAEDTEDAHDSDALDDDLDIRFEGGQA